MSYARITGVGSFLPERILTNSDLEKIVDTSNEWIIERSGISARHIAGETDTVVSMAETAALQALKQAGITANQLDLIIVATCTPEHMFHFLHMLFVFDHNRFWRFLKHQFQ